METTTTSLVGDCTLVATGTMGKEKKNKEQTAQAEASEAAATRSSAGSGSKKAARASAGAGEASTSALIICRNKHWRYISSFHGPWLQLPPEVLTSLAHSNYLSPRPHPIDPAVFYDVVKIRRHVDEATTLAVRATSGLTSAALNHSGHGHGHSMLGPAAAALGMGTGCGNGGGGGGGGGGGTLSRERKHRMRELATSKLSAAYRLDEIATSVATMQSASTLEDVAQLVLQRSPHDVDAKYVHFFHEKIPSRMMAQCTPLDALDDVVTERPADGSALRTRALTRIFKDDYANSARDLTAALAAARYLPAAHEHQHRAAHQHQYQHQHQHQHRAAQAQLVLANTHTDRAARDWRTEPSIPDDDDQPSSLESQLLFHRAGVYFAIACRHVHAALDGLQQQEEAAAARHALRAAGEQAAPETPDDLQARLFRAESRKQVRQNAKRALRDYTAFLSRFDYTPGLSADVAQDFLRRYHSHSHSHSTAHTNTSNDYQSKLDRLLQESSTSEALIPYKKPSSKPTPWPDLPPPPVFTLNQLFDAVPPPALPPYPLPPNTPPSPLPINESVTYHPLLPDALHALLLVHALLQTPAKELLRHAHNAARLVRLLDGYPIFLAARSPARSDWVEVLRRGGNWIGLTSSWEKLCRPSAPPSEGQNGHVGNGTVSRTGVNGARAAAGEKEETKEQRRERQKHEAILEALADERVVDEESFQRAVRAREKRFRDDEKAEAAMEASAASSPATISNGSASASEKAGSTPPKRWAQDDTREYPISTERAEAISRWVRDAPALTSENNTGKKKRRKGTGNKAGLSKASSTGLEDSIASLGVDQVE